MRSDECRQLFIGAVGSRQDHKECLEDMEEAMRHSANVNSMSDVKEIYLERCGEISIVKKKE